MILDNLNDIFQVVTTKQQKKIIVVLVANGSFSMMTMSFSAVENVVTKWTVILNVSLLK